MGFYVLNALFHFYLLMNPLSRIDLSPYRYPEDFVHPLWNNNNNNNNKDDDERFDMHLRVYLSSKERFGLQTAFEADEFETTGESNIGSTTGSTAEERMLKASKKGTILLWDQKVDLASFSKSFLLTTTLLDDNSDDGSSNAAAGLQLDDSYKYAVDWLDHLEHMAKSERDGDAGVLASISAASGHGIESTSFLLMAYESISKKIRLLLETIGILGTTKSERADLAGLLDRSTVSLDPASPIWSALQSNATVYLHVLVLRSGVNAVPPTLWPPASRIELDQAIRTASSTQSLLLGQAGLVKHDLPKHIEKPKRYLYKDLQYCLRKLMGSVVDEIMPPWEMAFSKPEEYASYQKALDMKKRGMGYPYWKPEVSIKYVSDTESYPVDMAHASGMRVVRLNRKSAAHPQGMAFLPALHVDEMGMTSEKYIPLNETVTTLPLRISFDRSDMEHKLRSGSTATSGGISPARWRLLNHLGEAIEKQRDFGFDESDIDDLKRLIADTNLTLLTITMLASTLHLLFEFLTFKSEVSFWKKNKDLTGLSVGSLFMDLIGQTIVWLFLIEADSSLLTTVPAGISCLIAIWKCQRGAGFQFLKCDGSRDPSLWWWNRIFRLFGYELRAMRLEGRVSSTTNDNGDRISSSNVETTTRERLIAMTIESDRIATTYLGALLVPLAAAYTLYSFFYNEHRSWYSWIITSSASAVYALGFVLMTPQLFLNWKMKSVAHLPWRVLIYKSLNTFIDDLFSFIIRMPTMARLSCFRDDVIFFVYLYQRWLYPVDKSRPIEGGGEGEHGVGNTPSDENGETKKDK